MKFTLLAILYCILAISVPSTRTYAQAPLANVEGNASAITGKLTKLLSLKDDQPPKVLNFVTDFLRLRNTLLSGTAANPKAYDAKIKSLHTGFYKKLKSVMTAEQYDSFLQQKPAENDPTNVLSQLYY
jgi:hypothetical protein